MYGVENPLTFFVMLLDCRGGLVAESIVIIHTALYVVTGGSGIGMVEVEYR